MEDFMDFSIFDEAINNEQFKNDLKDAKENAGPELKEVPKGEYTVKLDKMEIKPTKTDKYPMFSVQMRITEGEFKNQCIFFNRKIYGNKVSDKWNDAKAIQTVVTWVSALETEIKPVFVSYSGFNDVLLDIYEEVKTYDDTFIVNYDPDAFNSIQIVDIKDKD